MDRNRNPNTFKSPSLPVNNNKKQLAVYLNKIFTGIFEQNSGGGGALSFTYDKKYLESRNARAVSISLPLRKEAFSDGATRAFFSGLLPDDKQLTFLAHRLKISEKNPFALLFEIGRDCAGAIEILPIGEKLPSYLEGSKELLTEESLYKIIGETRTNPLLAGTKKIRLSLAGAQSKLAVFFDEETNLLPELVIKKPSTHIIKPEMPDFPNSVYNEFFCMKLAKKINLDTAEVFFKNLKDKHYLLIRRYDREKNPAGFYTRIHQEDFCQALSLPPESKYQGVDGGPGINDCLDLIERNSSRPAFDKIAFTRAIIFNYIIGNCDAHGKNFSFLYDKEGTRLAPFYDLISTTAFPETSFYQKLENKMAMKIGKSFDPKRISLKHWQSIIPNTNTAKANLEKELLFFAKELPLKAAALKEELVKQGITSSIFDTIIIIITKRCKHILEYFEISK